MKPLTLRVPVRPLPDGTGGSPGLRLQAGPDYSFVLATGTYPTRKEKDIVSVAPEVAWTTKWYYSTISDALKASVSRLTHSSDREVVEAVAGALYRVRAVALEIKEACREQGLEIEVKL